MKRLFISLAVLAGLVACSSPKEELKSGFDNPPNSARIRVWWHWMNGNITKDGIKKDLEWMDRVGIGGFHHFDAALGTPQVVEKRLIYMDEGWKDALAYASRKADSLGLEMTITSSPGWSATGGPWVPPQDAMKKLVWRTMDIDGGVQFKAALKDPFKSIGAFQNSGAQGRGSAAKIKEYYEDIAVIAVALPEDDLNMKEMGAKLSSSGGKFDLDQLSDDDVVTSSLLPNGKENAWILFEFPKAQTIRAVSLADGRGGGRGPSAAPNASVYLEASDNGKDFTFVSALTGGGAVLRTVGIPATTARFFRVVYKNQGPQGGNSLFGNRGPAPAAPVGTRIAELVLHSASKVNRAQDKAGFTAASLLTESPSVSSPKEAFANAKDVIDITDKMDANGVLNWNVPEGRWRVYRFGFSLTGKQNHPAPPEATGLEVDKLDPAAWRRYFTTYLDMYKEATDDFIGKKGAAFLLNDSYEAEQENWTPSMFEEFRNRRGYDLTPWLPVLTGQVVGSPEQSDAFLWDWRKTIGELIYSNYELMSTIAQEYGMKGRYSEAHEGGRVYPVDGMDVKKAASVPMSAMWVCAPWLGRTMDGQINRSGYMTDCQESASVAHVYGQQVAAAESLTAWGNVQYSYSPENLKAVADLELACGINRFVIHESAHQPSDTFVPGLSLGGIGQWFNRHDTWAEQAGIWVNYLSRSSYLLMTGYNVADVLVYYGEDANVTGLFGSKHVSLDFGFNFDYLNPDGLLNQIEFKDGTLRSKSGTKYKVLWLERNTKTMSTAILEKIAQLAKAGAVIVGPRPTNTTGLLEDRAKFDALVAEIWDAGRKNVYENDPISKVFGAEGITADLVAEQNVGLRFLHRTYKGTEIYWINKPSNEYKTLELSFRVKGLKPEIWHPDNGKIEDASYKIVGDRTIVKVDMVPDDAVFVVFADKASQNEVQLAKRNENVVKTLDASWNVKFQAGRGAPETAVFNQLKSYTESSEFGIKYFSGRAEYTTSFELAEVNGNTIIDLGNVGNLAEVYVNGKYCGTAWKQPFRVDISDAVCTGKNEIKLNVVNLWVNRLIGDEQPNCPQKITFTDARHYKADSPLLPSGLMGPVKIVAVQ